MSGAYNKIKITEKTRIKIDILVKINTLEIFIYDKKINEVT